MALRRVHKLYLDSRAAKERSHGHGEFVWAIDRPLVVDRCRAFIDSVHIPQSFESIGPHNANTYVAEEQVGFTVLAGQNKVYIQEITGGVTSQRVVQISPAAYVSEATLAVAVQAALGGVYSVTSGAGVLTITEPNLSSKIVSRRELYAKTTFANAPEASAWQL